MEIINPGGLVNGMTLKDLGKKSLCRNNLLFGLMQRMDLIEKSGTGFLRIRRALKKYKLAPPKIETNEHWFTLTFMRPNLQEMTIRERLEGGTIQESVEKSVEKIMNLMKLEPEITQTGLAEKTGLSRRGVEKNIKILKEKGLIKRIGPDRGGYWEVIKG